MVAKASSYAAGPGILIAAQEMHRVAQQAAEIVQPQQIAAACVEVNAMREAEESLAVSIKLSESDDGTAELDAAEGLCDEVEGGGLGTDDSAFPVHKRSVRAREARPQTRF